MSDQEQDVGEIQEVQEQEAQPQRKKYTMSKKAIETRIENLRKGREARLKRVAETKQSRKQEYEDTESETESEETESEETETESESEPEYVLQKKKGKGKAKGKAKPKHKQPTKSELKMMEKMDKIEKFMSELKHAKKVKPKTKTKSKTMIVYPPSQPASVQSHVSEKEKKDLVGMF